jgi:hypothetical protein
MGWDGCGKNRENVPGGAERVLLAGSTADEGVRVIGGAVLDHGRPTPRRCGVPMSIYALNPPHALKITTREIHGTRCPLLVIDNLYRTPDHVRALAVSRAYREGAEGGHPGEFAEVELREPLEALHDLVHRNIGDRCGYTDTAAHAIDPDRAHFFHLPLADRFAGASQCLPHVDDTLLACVIYLNRPEHCRGGTAFFRHRPTGIADYRLRPHRPVDPRVLEACRRMGVDERWREGVHTGAWPDHAALGERLWRAHEHEWEALDAVIMRYNRLVCYPGFVFHAPLYRPSWFGETPEQRRLTHNLFFAWPRADRSAAW